MRKNKSSITLKALYSKAKQVMTPTRLRTFKGFEHLTDTAAEHIIKSLDCLCEIFLRSAGNPNEKDLGNTLPNISIEA